jgi:predicted nucleotide-binding protein
VPSVKPELFDRLRDKTGLSQARVYGLIAQKANATLLPRDLAAIALANDLGINVNKYATAEDLATIRAAARGEASPPVVAPAVTRPARAKQTKDAAGRRRRRRKEEVFLIHGRNEQITREMKALLRAMGLTPVAFPEALRRTRSGAPFIGEVLDSALKKDQPVVVLLTPDDAARLQAAHRKKSDAAHESMLTGQARPNVLFEAGMAFGRSPRSTVLVEVGKLRPFSDAAGRHAVHLDDEVASHLDFASKLENAGAAVDRSGDDWQSGGDFRIRSAPARRRRAQRRR